MNETTKYRNNLWTKLDQVEANCKYYLNKARIKGQKEAIIKKLQPITVEAEWDKVLKSLNKNKFPSFYIENYTFTLRWCNLCNEFRTLISRERKDCSSYRYDLRKELIKENRRDYANKKTLKKKMIKIWEVDKNDMLKIDWLEKKENVDEFDMMKNKVAIWKAGVKKTLHLGKWDKGKRLLEEVVGQRFSKCKGSSNVVGSNQTRMGSARDFVGYILDAKSFVETSRVMDFALNNLMWAAGINYKEKNIKLMMKIYAIKELDKLACRNGEVFEKTTQNNFTNENDWKPRSHSAAPDVKALDDVEPQHMKVSSSDLSKLFFI
jgi:hypothetical protein